MKLLESRIVKLVIIFCILFLGIYIYYNDLLVLKRYSSAKDDLYKDPTLPIEDRVENLLSLMTLDEKIGQMAQIERMFASKETLQSKYGVGSVFSEGNSRLHPDSARECAHDYKEFQKLALSTRLGIPIIYGIDAVHGQTKVQGSVIFPHNIGLGATRNPELVREVGRITALEALGAGMNWNFGPCLAVARDERWGRTYESFSENPELVSELGLAKIEGMQGKDLSDGYHIAACAKHWVGDGGTTDGVDRSNTELDEETLRRIHIEPYKEAIKEGVATIMISQSCWNGTEMHAQKYLITDVLKKELGFDGFVVSDYAGIDQIPGNYLTDVKIGINAGIDMVMIPHNLYRFTNTLKFLVKTGQVPMERIDDAVRRILRVKFRMGLFEKPFIDEGLTSKIGSKEHREIGRQAVRESLVLLKNEVVLPLKTNLAHLHITGARSRDLGSQCGGWTISWQGTTGDITEGTTILEAIQQTVSPQTEVTYSSDGSIPQGAEVCIAVIGEKPYAEWFGDRKNLELSLDDRRLLEKAFSYDIPVVVILISGRPMIITSEIKNSEAFIAAWLPGTEGMGVADVLFGKYNPTGKLPFTWPRSMEQIPINVGDENYDPLFPYGYGLSY